jgi:tol-pal system protein YbgF
MVDMRAAFVTSLVVLGLALATPSYAQNRREMQMMADIRMLQEQTQQLQQQMQTAITQLADALKAINARIDDQTGSTRKAFADQKLTVDELSNNLRVVRERVDDTNVRIGSLSQEVEALRLAIPQFPAAGQPPVPAIDPNQPGAPTPGEPVPAPAPVAPPPPVAAGPGVSPQRMFDTAWSDYTTGQWALCVAGFDQYLRTFPRSELAGDAQFYIGECNFSDGKFTEAVDAYNRVITNYPRSSKVPDSLYKRALALERLSQFDRARESYEMVMKTYPDSEAARLAKQNLARLNRGRPQ